MPRSNSDIERRVFLPERVLVSLGTAGDFQSVKAAVDWCASQFPSSSNPFLVEVGPGVYTEQPFTIPPWVKVQGAGWLLTVLMAADLTQHFIELGAATVLRDVNIFGPTTALKAAVHHAPNDIRAAAVIETTISRGYYGILSDPSTTRSPLLTQNLVNASAGSVITGFIRAEGYADIMAASSVAAGPPGAILKGFSAVGPNASLLLISSLFECPGGDAVFVDDGALLKVQGCALSRGLNALRVGSTGSGSRMLVVGTSIQNLPGSGFTKDILIESATASVHFDGKLTLSRVDNTIGCVDFSASGLNVESVGGGEFVIGTSLLVGSGDYPRHTFPPYAIFDYPKLYAERVVESISGIIPGNGNRTTFNRLIMNPPGDTTERGWGMQCSADVATGCNSDFACGYANHPDLMGVEGTVVHNGNGRVDMAAGLFGYVFTGGHAKIGEAVSSLAFQPTAGGPDNVIDKGYCFKAAERHDSGTVTKKYSFVAEDGTGPGGIGYAEPEAAWAVKGGISAGRNVDPGLGRIRASSAFELSGGLGGYRQKLAEATASLLGATSTITLSVPSQAKILAVQLRVDALITSGDGGTSWSSAFTGGSATVIALTQAFAKNTKADKMLPGEVVSGVTDILVTCNGGTFSGGTVRAIVYYEELEPMPDAP
jgi:hypothetical protein